MTATEQTKTEISARVLADSISPAGVRLVTIEAIYPRSIHAEVLTHRVFCIAGDTQLEFDLPTGAHGYVRRVYTMRMDEFVDKWQNGARRIGAKRKIHADLTTLDDRSTYTPHQLAIAAGLSTHLNINAACRSGVLGANKGSNGRAWLVTGKDFKAWRASIPEDNRYDMRDRLRSMRIRQLDEATGRITTSTVNDCWVSGVKRVYEVQAGKYSVAGSQDHCVLTPDGYLRIAELIPGRSQIVVRRRGKLKSEYADKIRLRKIDGRWRSAWQRTIRERMVKAGEVCSQCSATTNLHVHHIVSVHHAPALVFDPDNIVLLCQPCHRDSHRTQGWQGGTYLYGDIVTVDSVRYRSSEPTYDLSVAGPFENYLANGVVVHNSRNAASSRAIPLSVSLRRVATDPFLPTHWGRNQKGMQAGEELDAYTIEWAKQEILTLRDHAVTSVKRLEYLGLHKQIANRYLEPWQWYTAIITSTEWLNFLHLRKNKDAEPHLQDLATAIYDAIRSSVTEKLQEYEWHLPLIQRDELINCRNHLELAQISAARCARVSYLTHSGVRDRSEDLKLFERLETGGHLSPLEHPAQARRDKWFVGNLRGWESLRQQIPGESDVLAYRGEAEELEGLEGLH